MIHGTKSYSENDYHNYISDRDNALFSLKERKIKHFYKKYGVEIPENKGDFWIGVANLILEMDERRDDVPDKAKIEALKILDEFNERITR